MRPALRLCFLLTVMVWPNAATTQEGARVLVSRVDGAITPVVADHLDAAAEEAAAGGYAALLVELDTPGGLDVSMRDIVQSFLAADVPVIVYVSPQGARAASAGALITFSAHIAAMAPGTAIGAATPVDLEGGEVERKVINDAAAFAESVARARDRNVEFAVATVREGRSAPADQAAEIGAIDFLALDLDEVLGRAHGRAVEVRGQDRTVHTAGAAIDEYDMGLFRQLQQRLADPSLAFLFMSLGTLALLYELANPGLGAGGVVGVVLILLALFGLAVLPVNLVGFLLLALAMALFVAELFAPGIGIAAVGGAVSLVLSAIFLFRDVPGMHVSLAVVAPLAVVTAGGAILAGRLVVRSHRGHPSSAGAPALVGRTALVARSRGATGQAMLDGAWWTVRSVEGSELLPGTVVRVEHVDGIELLVSEEAQGEGGEPDE